MHFNIRVTIVYLFYWMPLVMLLVFSQSVYAQKGKNSPSGADSSGSVKTSVTYLTLRNETGKRKPKDYYGSRRSDAKSGICHHERSTRSKLKKWSDKSPIKFSTDKNTVSRLSTMSSSDFDAFLDQAAKRGRIVMYIHGYNVEFTKACRRAAALQNALELEGSLFLFSWPADGKQVSYTRDEADLEWTVDFLQQFLAKLANKYPGASIQLVGHSLGTRGLVKALAFGEFGPKDKPLFDHLVLLAPDIDTDVFQQLLPRVRPRVRNITVYASDGDNALKLSREVHGYPRLGEAGAYLTLADGVDTVDVSRVEAGSSSGHGYHTKSPEVLRDLEQLLKRNLLPGKRDGLKQKEVNGRAYWELQPGH